MVGAKGMGGVGKSVLAAMAARRPELSEQFTDGLYWITLGETPLLVDRWDGPAFLTGLMSLMSQMRRISRARLISAVHRHRPPFSLFSFVRIRLSELHVMLTGRQPEPPFVDPRLATILLRQLLVGKRVLLVLDDVWAAEHAAAFDCCDPNCAKRLLTSRKADLAKGVAQVEPSHAVRARRSLPRLVA